MTRTITYNGKSVKTKYHSALEWQEFHELRAQYYAKPSIEQVQLEILKFHQGGIKTTLITNYYFKALMSKVILYHSKFSIQEVFMCKELLEVFTGKVALNKKVFPESQPLIMIFLVVGELECFQHSLWELIIMALTLTRSW